MRQRPPKTLRLSPELEQLISTISDNENAVMRALLLIGADTIGLDVRTVQADVRRSLSADLPPAIQTRLIALLQRGQVEAEPERHAAPAAPATGATEAGGSEPDPFASVGFDFD